MIEKRKSEIDEIQSEQYSFPYHYIPTVNGFPNFSKGWSFSASYIAAINLFADWLKDAKTTESINLHMDFGCGDGGFLYNVIQLRRFKDVDFMGIDFDSNEINWAKQFSQSENFTCGDVADLPSSTYDSGSLIEVYEHIPPSECPNFLKKIANSLKKNAPLFVTVPSTQKKVTSKHYRHFDFDILLRELGEHFIVDEIFGFEKKNTLVKIINRLFSCRWWHIETKITNRLLVHTLQSKHSKIDGCGRIGIVVRKK